MVHGEKVSIRTPEDAVAHGIGYLSEDRKHFGLATGMDVESNIVLASMRRFLSLGFFLASARIRETAATFVRRLGIKTPSVAQKVRPALGRQPAEDRDRQMAGCAIATSCSSTSRRAASTSAPRARSTSCCNALAEQGKAIVMISSELPEVLRLSHRILVMCEGRDHRRAHAGREPRRSRSCSWRPSANRAEAA